MSIHLERKIDKNVATLFWNEMQKEERAVLSAEREIVRLTAELNRWQDKINRLRKALKILGVKTNNGTKEE